VVLSSHVFNRSSEEFPYVRNELAIQVAYETDLPFTRRLMIDVADDYLGDEMAARIATYRERFAESGVELEVGTEPRSTSSSASRGWRSGCGTSHTRAGERGSGTSSTSGSSWG